MLQQAVAAAGAAIQHVDQVRVTIDVREEIVAEQIDLHKRFLFGKRLELHFLHANHFFVGGELCHEAVGIEFAYRCGSIGANLAVEHARLELAKLAKNLSGGNVDSGVHVLFGFLDANDVALRAQRNLADSGGCVCGVLLHVQDDFGIKRINVHDLHGIADFFLGVHAQRVGYRHLASGDGNAHVNHLFLAAVKKVRRESCLLRTIKGRCEVRCRLTPFVEPVQTA